jgi:two-component system nitrate/nitrite response regulator NarL
MREPETIRVVIADDHHLVRSGLRRLLESEEGFRVIGEAGDGVEAVLVTRQLRPDVLLLDLAMPRATGLEALQDLASSPCDVRTMVLTGAGAGQADLLTALRLGARGVVLKESDPALLFKSIRCVMAGEYWLGHANIANLVAAVRQLSAEVEALAKPNRFGLTDRELQVLEAAAAGESNKEISARLNVRVDTIKHHLSNIYDKVGVFSRVELAVFAMNHGLTSHGARASGPPARTGAC